MRYSDTRIVVDRRGNLFDHLDARFDPDDLIEFGEVVAGIENYRSAREFSDDPYEPEYVDVEAYSGNIETLDQLVEEVPAEIAVEVVGERHEEGRRNQNTVFLTEVDIDGVISGLEDMFEQKEDQDSFRTINTAWSYGPNADKKRRHKLAEKLHRNPFKRGVRDTENREHEIDIGYIDEPSSDFAGHGFKIGAGGASGGTILGSVATVSGSPEFTLPSYITAIGALGYTLAANGIHGDREYEKGVKTTSHRMAAESFLNEISNEDEDPLHLEVTDWSLTDHDEELDELAEMNLIE